MMNKELMVEEFNHFISEKGPWDLWITITFRGKTQLTEAKNAFKRFMKHINSKEAFYGNYMLCFALFEKDARKGVHIHALLRGIHPLYAPTIEKMCLKQFGQSKVAPHYAHRNAIMYLSAKYNTPSLECYDLMKINTKLRRKTLAGLAKKVRL